MMFMINCPNFFNNNMSEIVVRNLDEVRVFGQAGSRYLHPCRRGVLPLQLHFHRSILA